MTQEALKQLLQKYLEHKLSATEFERMWGTLSDPALKDTWLEFIRETWDSPAHRHLASETARRAGLQNLLPQIRERRRPFVPVSMRWLAAACVAGLLASAFFLTRNNDQAPVAAPIAQAPAAPVILPGGNKAVLTLGDGTVIELDSAANGTLGRQGNARVVKLANGNIAYTADGQGAAEVMYNTMRTPRGGQYRITLPDGTSAWLNAASSITYPTAFTGNERVVKVTGEVYFEVAKQAGGTPFRVEIMTGTGEVKGEVAVLGTHFNINAYDNESAVKTTLLEGAVKVRKTGEAYVSLHPGQQASIAGTVEVARPDNLEAVTAWKNGYFVFNQTDIQAMMRQAERWYNITVEYPEGIPSDRFSGTLSRGVDLLQFLEILAYSDVNASIKERTVTITP
ncbi:FecR family protein [Chitinophaga sp.]|uniref:FecR family protein n=1 Tax=Chitinophaga sp. TaxID=1869181 RepID=UPI0031D477B0